MNLTSNQALFAVVGALVVIGILAAVTSSRRAAKRAAKGVREVTRMTSTAVRSVVVAAIITGIEWVVVTSTHDPKVVWPTLGLPALFAGVQVARLFAVREVIYSSKRGGR